MAFVRTDGPKGTELAIPPSYYRSRGGLMGVLGLLFGSACCCLPIGIIGSGAPVDEGVELLGALVLFGVAIGIVAPVMGALIAARAEALAACSLVQVDSNAVYSNGRTFPLTTIARLELGKGTGGSFLIRGWPRWLLIDQTGATHALSEGVYPPLDRKRTARVIERVAQELGVPFQDRSSAIDVGITAPICYLPIGAFFFPASLLVLVFGKEAEVRFAAKQSLLHLAFTFGVATMLGGLCAATFVFCQLADVTPVLVAVPALVLVLTIFVLNVVLRFYAMFRASRDPLWVMPWLGRITRRWADRVENPGPLGF